MRIPSTERSRRFARRVSRSRWRLASSTACSAATLLVLTTGCGGGERPQAELDRDVGAALAAQTAAVEDALVAGQVARARAEADELIAAVTAAINRGDVPPPLQEELLGAAQRLASLIPAPAEPHAPPPADEKGKGKGKGNGDKDKGEDGEKDEGKDGDEGDE